MSIRPSPGRLADRDNLLDFGYSLVLSVKRDWGVIRGPEYSNYLYQVDQKRTNNCCREWQIALLDYEEVIEEDGVVDAVLILNYVRSDGAVEMTTLEKYSQAG